MAVARIKEFTIDLSQVVKSRVDSFSLSRQRFQAMREANFQRRVKDEDLSFQEQLDYKNELFAEEEKNMYPDTVFLDSLKTKISDLKKLVKAKKFRDKYFDFLQDLSEGRKSLQDHLEFLESEVKSGGWSQENIEKLEDKSLEVKSAITSQNTKIIDAQIAFYEKDNTMDSFDKAIALVKKQLASPIVQKDKAILSAYGLELETLEKEKLETKIEDDMSSMVVDLVSKERQNSSLWKVDNFSSLMTGSGIDTPVNIDGTKYASEQEYWQTTLNNYVQQNFAEEYVKENKLAMDLFYNQTGFLTNTFLQNLMKKNDGLRNEPSLQGFQQIVDTSIQGTITEALGLKVKELKAKYYLDSPDIATVSGYTAAISNLNNMKTIFGSYYSMSPAILAFESSLIEKKWQLTQNILDQAQDYAIENDITVKDAIDILGPYSEIELPPESYVEKTPTETAGQAVEAAGKVGQTPTTTIPTIAPTQPPTPTITPGGETYTVQSGDTLSDIASQYGITWQELYSLNPQITNPNLIQPNQIINIPGEQKATPTPAQIPTPTPTPTPAPVSEPATEPAPSSAPKPVSSQDPTYNVASGDTLSSIAAKSGISWQELHSLNPQISNPNLIHPGDVVNLPKLK